MDLILIPAFLRIALRFHDRSRSFDVEGANFFSGWVDSLIYYMFGVRVLLEAAAFFNAYIRLGLLKSPAAIPFILIFGTITAMFIEGCVTLGVLLGYYVGWYISVPSFFAFFSVIFALGGLAADRRVQQMVAFIQSGHPVPARVRNNFGKHLIGTLGTAWFKGFAAGLAAWAITAVIGWDLRGFVYSISFYLNVYVFFPLSVVGMATKTMKTLTDDPAKALQRAQAQLKAN